MLWLELNVENGGVPELVPELVPEFVSADDYNMRAPHFAFRNFGRNFGRSLGRNFGRNFDHSTYFVQIACREGLSHSKQAGVSI
ncbi:MAG: hypothetical protein COA43_10385 [Robiginitomaculum sp.]|nr:MAG: hypothetical protein COA43_10385 [Robiginitomaculum sp.]